VPSSAGSGDVQSTNRARCVHRHRRHQSDGQTKSTSAPRPMIRPRPAPPGQTSTPGRGARQRTRSEDEPTDGLTVRPGELTDRFGTRSSSANPIPAIRPRQSDADQVSTGSRRGVQAPAAGSNREARLVLAGPADIPKQQVAITERQRRAATAAGFAVKAAKAGDPATTGRRSLVPYLVGDPALPSRLSDRDHGS
jgi:hypothetical protein